MNRDILTNKSSCIFQKPPSPKPNKPQVFTSERPKSSAFRDIEFME